MRIAFAAKAVAFLFVISNLSTTFGSIIVDVGSYSVTAGTPIVAHILVSNGSGTEVTGIEGMTFTVQIGDGTGNIPKITSVDLLTGTVWSDHVSPLNVSIPAGGDEFQYQSRDLLTDVPGEFVDVNGLLAVVTFDTTGIALGDYAIKLVGTKTAGRDSVFLNGFGEPVAATFGQGSISIVVPEPRGILLGLSGLSAFIVLVRARSFLGRPRILPIGPKAK